MSDLLLELFSEEIPARMQERAQSDLHDAMQKGFAEAGLSAGTNLETGCFSTPRRIAFWAKNLPVELAATETELKGPKTNAPEAALQGFLKKNNLQKNDLSERGGTYFAIVRKEGKATANVLKPLIEEILKTFPWPKSMRWGNGDATWVRPLHSILCLLDGGIIPVEFGGVKAGNITYGHRFLSPAAITITNVSDYEMLLEKAHVMVDRGKRKAHILKQAEAVANTKGLNLKKDDALLEEVTGLVEWPVLLMGTIDAKFMDLPPEVLTTVMRSHQKYFALVNKSETLSSHFLITANMQTDDNGKAIIAGNERVLRARFSDARFFWDQDRKKPLAEWAQGLKDVTYHAKLGSIADKIERIKTLAIKLMPNVDPGLRRDDVERAAALSKADLVTGMVGEFAELQGIMGRYYTQAQGEAPAVADAIRDHYKPQGPNDAVPMQPVSICIALADKLDTLIGLFMVGEKPTGSKDPFALRRAALGVIRIIMENNLRFSLGKFISSSSSIYEEIRASKLKAVDPISQLRADENDLLNFFADRLVVQLKDSGIRHDVIKAVIAGGDDDLVRIVARAKAVQEFLGTDDGKNLLAAYKRAANILAIEEKKDKKTYTFFLLYEFTDTKEILTETEENSLINEMEFLHNNIQEPLKAENFNAAMHLLSKLRQPVDQFFDKIMVNCENKELRANRLRLLATIKASMDNIANFALIEG